MLALQQLGFTVTPLDYYRHVSSGSRVARSARHRFAWGLEISRLNHELVAAARGEFDWIWIEKGVWIIPETLAAIQSPGRRLIHYTPDSMFYVNKSRHFMQSIPQYDVLITPKRFEIDLYRRHGARRVMLLLHGYDQRLFRPLPSSTPDLESYSSDLCFVGRYEPHYRRRIHAAAETRAEVAVWGAWGRAARVRPWLRGVLRGGGVWDEDYVRVLNGAKIGLGLLTRLAPDESTTRTFEIPACGTMLLAERSREHSELFEEGQEAEFFTSDGEMQEKIRWYLSHDKERSKIAAAGHARGVTSGYSYLERMRSATATIE